MKNFNHIGALRSVLQDVYEKCPSEAEQRLANFAGVLEQQLDFIVPLLCVRDDGKLWEFESTFLLSELILREVVFLKCLFDFLFI